MLSRKFFRASIAVVVVAASFSFHVETADAQRRTLLEQIFPRAAERIRQNRARQNADAWGQQYRDPAQRQKPVIKKVRGPQYYTYKPEKLTTLAIASLLPAAGSVGAISNLEDNRRIPHVLPSTMEKTPPIRTLLSDDLKDWSIQVETDIAKAMQSHYSQSPEFLWVDQQGKPNANAKRLSRVFGRALSHGLLPDDYKLGVNIHPTDNETADWQAAARFEMAMTSHALRYAADARHGLINPNLISGYHDFPGYERDYGQLMKEIAASTDPAAFLESLHPSNRRYVMLKRELSDLHIEAMDSEIEPIATGTFLKAGMSSPELPKIIRTVMKRGSEELQLKHQETLAAYDNSEAYSAELVAIVRDFQKENGLSADGIIGKNTVNALQLGNPKAKIERVRLAMERLRWLPDDFGRRHVFINQPAYEASYVVDDNAKLSMKTIVGSPANQTYFFHDVIETVEVNPYWNVPRSILVNEMLGNIQSDPGYLSARNYEVVSYSGKVINPYNVDWYSSDPSGKVYIRQRPGSRNALGELKILFPNKHSIYMHDTPSRNLFGRSKRALSHGCIRLHKPREMAAAVLQTSVDQIGNYIAGGKNRAIRVEGNIPVYVSYFTAWPKDDGNVGYYTDIYGRDKALLKALEQIGKTRKEALASVS